MTYKSEMIGTAFHHVGYTLFSKKKHLKGILKKKDIDSIDMNVSPKCARVTFIDHAAFVMVNDKNCSLNDVHELLLHEAVHIWQHCRDIMGEDNPSCEFEAYQIQFIASNLFKMYDEMK